MNKFIYIVIVLCIGFTKTYSIENSYPKNSQNNFAYNFLPKTLNSRSYNFYAFGEFLYMQTSQEGLEYAVLNNTTDSLPGSGNAIPGKRIGFEDAWSYEPGIKVGLGYIDQNLWDAELYYSYVDIDTSTSFNFTNLGVLLPLWFAPPDNEALSLSKDSRAKWSGSLNALDFKIEKKIFLSKKLLFEPTIGVKAARIKQLYFVLMKVQYNFVTPIKEPKFTGNITFKGAGISAGINSEYYFLKHLYFFENFTFAILHSKFNVFQKYDGFTSNAVVHIIEETNKMFTNIPYFEILAGIAGKYSYKNAFLVELKIGYEMQKWFRQNQFAGHFDSHTSVNLGDDLSIKGLIIRFGVQF